MTDDALARFRAVADAVVQRGRRVATEARADGAAFQRDSERLIAEPRRDRGHRPAAADLRAAAAGYRTEQGLPLPETPGPGPASAGQPPADRSPADWREAGRTAAAWRPAPRPEDPEDPDDEDFSDFRVMQPL